MAGSWPAGTDRAGLTQLRATIDILRRRPGIEVPNDLSEALAAHSINEERLTELFTSSTPMMLAVARALDPEHAEDLVQNTWIDVLRSPDHGTVELTTLLTRLDTLADQHRATAVETDRPRDDLITEVARAEPDGDADTAELYYPGLYPHDPELGEWPGAAQILSPEDESTTEELYGVVDAALADLPRKVPNSSLVDIEGVPVDIDRARDYVRHRVDTFVSGCEPA